jgi:hypothetical protein
MNGNVNTRWYLLAAIAAIAGYVLYRQSAGADGGESGDSSGGDSSGGGASGASAGSYAGAFEGVTDWAAGLAQQAGLGVTRGLRNHNPFNLRYVPEIQWDGQIGDDGSGYAVFETDEKGCRAGGKQLKTYASRGLTSVAQIISTFAPSNENDTAAYIADVSQRLGVDPNQPLDVVAVLPQLGGAIIHHENGVQPFDLGDLAIWMNEP